MADNVAITAGAGTTISTDDVGAGLQVQRVKVQYGVDGTAADVTGINGLPIQGTQSTLQTTSWTSATTVNTANSISIVGMNTVTVAMNNTSTMTNGVLTFEVSPDSGTTWFPIAVSRIDSYTVETTYTLNTVAPRAWSTSVDGFTNFRVRLSTVITGTGTASVFVTAQTMPIEPIVTVGQSVAASLNATVTGTVTSNLGTGGTTATSIGKAEDAVSASGDTGVFVLGVQRAAPVSNVSATGDYAEFQLSPSNGLFVTPSPQQVLLTATPTISTTIYASGDVVGAALTFTGAATATARGGQVVSAVILDKGKQNANLALWLFAVSPTLVNADNGVFDITDANLVTALPIGVIDFVAGNYKTTNSNSICVGTINLGAPVLSFVTSATANIFGALSTTSTPTYASTTDLVVYLTVNQY